MAALALTFDDGPDPRWTPHVLDALAACGARATFFPIASRAARHPALIVRILAGGHTVGLHCDEHVRHSDRDEAWLHRDTAAALQRLAALGVRPRLWRTPWGVLAPWTPRVAALHGLRIVPWSVDTHDWRGDGAEAMLGRIRGGLESDAIVLAHDGLGPGARREHCEQTVALIPLVAAVAAERGLRLAALDEARAAEAAA